eukprot:COSAG02_NODE_396_length_23126_cov_282.150258_24_plen_125_part_00
MVLALLPSQVLLLLLLLQLQQQVAEATGPQPSPLLDVIVFGNGSSEAAHYLNASGMDATQRGDGTPRRSPCRNPASCRSGWPSESAVAFSMRVDPDVQNYFTVKFDGSEKSVQTRPALPDTLLH